MALAMLFSAILCGCSAAKQTATQPSPLVENIAETWTVTIANSSSNPTGWTFVPTSVRMGTIPVNPCEADFETYETLPISFESCATLTGIPLPQGQSTWLQTIIMGTVTAELYPGEGVYYVLQWNGPNGGTNAVLGGSGTFNSDGSVTGQLNCLSIDGSMTPACAAWDTTFTAK